MRGYELITIINLVLSYIYTKLFNKKARLIRLPVVIRNKRYIKFGNGFTTGRYCRIDAFKTEENKHIIFIGENCQINDSVHIAGIKKIKIGNNVLIASRVFISDHNHGFYSGDEQSLPISLVAKRPLSSEEVVIGDNVWIGENCSVLPGAIIGNNTIIGCNSVVKGVLDSDSIYVGAPVRKIKEFDNIENKWKLV